MSERVIGVSPLAQRTYGLLADPDGPRVVRHEGGTSSGKTRNVAHAWVRLLWERPGKLSVVRMSRPALRASVEEDVRVALQESGLPYEERAVENLYVLGNGAVVEMLALEGRRGAQKAHGPRRDYLWLNEANEIPLSIFKQLRLRTRRRIVLDYNPAMEDDHWIFAEYDGLPAAEVVTVRSTFEDNPFLEDEVRREILALKESDPYGWTVYGKGERGVPAYRVLPHVHALAEWPAVGNDTALGGDFGYHHPMVLLRVGRADGAPRPKLFVWVLFHRTLHTTGDLIAEMPELGVGKGEAQSWDSAEPDRIEEIRRAGYDARPAHKAPGSIKAGTDWLKRHDIYVGGPDGETARSELKRYRNAERNGALVDEPLDADNHVADALRYAAFTRWGRPAPPRIVRPGTTVRPRR